MQYSWDALQPLRRTLPRLDAIFCQYNRLLAASARAAAAGAGLEEAENARRAFVSGMEADILKLDNLNISDVQIIAVHDMQIVGTN